MNIEHYTDFEIVNAILNRNAPVTVEFMYRKCYPLFKALYDNYETDCGEVKEFIHEIYAFLLTPSKESKICPLMTYRSEGSLYSWMKLVGRTYCYARFRKKEKIQIELIDLSDIYASYQPSVDFDMSTINKMDIEKLLTLMPNKRYSRLIGLKYVKSFTHEETAQALGMTMTNYYNKHKLAKEQFIKIYKKEFGK